jgi:hypothetical protein
VTGADWAEDRERYGMMQPEVTKYKPPKELHARCAEEGPHEPIEP